MCHSRDQLRFRLEELHHLHSVTQWVLARIEQGYDLHWDLSRQYLIWICVPGNRPALEEFLGHWGNYVSADSRI